MKKILVLAGAAAMLVSLSACKSCWDPIDEKCIIHSHDVKTNVSPDAVAFSQVTLLPTKDAYRPTFTPGTKRVKGVGNGRTMERALQDAVAKICLENDCDMLSAAKAIVVRTTHPFWLFFCYDTYQVTLSGLPLTLTGLVKEMLPVPPPPPAPAPVCECKKLPPPPPPLTKEDIKAIFVELIKIQKPAPCPPCPPCPPALIHLKDIRLSMTATADCDSKIGVKLPASCNRGK